MAFQDLVALFTALLVVLLPGIAVLLALQVRRTLWIAGLAPVCSVGVATLVGMLCGLVGLPYNGWALGIATMSLLVVGGFGWWRARRSAGEPAVRRVRNTRALVTTAFGAAVLLGAFAYTLRTWLSGMGRNLSSIPQEHDTIVHTELVAYIMRTGRGAAWQLLPIDLLSGGPVSFYPSGMHLLSAAVAGVVGDPVLAFNAVTVVLLGVCLALSAAALTFVAARQARLGAPLSLVAAAIAALVAVGLNAPTISFASQGGVLPNAAALILSLGVVAVLLDLRRRDWLAAVAVAVGCVGLLALHPSAAMTVGLTLLGWWAGQAIAKGGLARIRQALAPTALAALVTGVLGAPLFAQLISVSGRTASFPPDVAVTPLSVALEQTLQLPLTGYLPEYSGRIQVAALVLAGLGVAVLVLSRRMLGPVLALAVWVLVTVGMRLSPGTGYEAAITGFFYNSIMRVQAHVGLLVPVLAGLGVVITAAAVGAWWRRHVPGRFAPAPAWAALAIAGVVVAGYALVPAKDYMRVSAHYLASRYGAPDLPRVGVHDQDGFDFLDGKVKPGERVMNSANDGSTYLYVEKNIPVVNSIALGFAQAPYTYQLLTRFDTYPTDAEIRKEVVDLNITWVYVDTEPPNIGAAGSPENWAGGGVFNTAPGLESLDGLPGLTEEFRSGPVRIYRLDLDVVKGIN
jgi:hypothetical protein